MAVQLKGSEGYYSREVEIDGSAFRIREMVDEELRQFGGGIDSLQTEITTAAGAETEPKVSTGIEITSKAWGVIDRVLRVGLVWWGIAGADCTPENVVLLPNHVKRMLYREIIADSGLTNEERAVLGG